MLRLPGRAVRRHHHRGCLVRERRDGRRDDRAVPEVEPAQDGVHAVHAGEPLGVPDDVDDPGVAAAGEHDEPAVPDVDDDRLVVVHDLVRPPGAVAERLVRRRHAGLERRRAVDLAGDQQHPVQQERRLPAFHDREPGTLDSGPARRRQLQRPVGRDDPPAEPEVRVQEHRQAGPAEPPGQAVEAHHVVEVPVAEDDGLERLRRDRQPVEVADEPVRRDAGVEQDAAGGTGVADLHQRREPVLRAQEVQAGHLECQLRRHDGSGPAVPLRPHRRTSPSSGSNASDELSINVVTWTPSTGKRRDLLHPGSLRRRAAGRTGRARAGQGGALTA